MTSAISGVKGNGAIAAGEALVQTTSHGSCAAALDCDEHLQAQCILVLSAGALRLLTLLGKIRLDHRIEGLDEICSQLLGLRRLSFGNRNDDSYQSRIAPVMAN